MALGKHFNWDNPDGWKTGKSFGWNEGLTVPHLVTLEADSSASVGGYFLDICLEHLSDPIIGYNGLAPYDSTLDPGVDNLGNLISIDDTFGPFDAENANLWSLTDGGLLGFDCDNTGEWGWRLVFSVPTPNDTTRIYYGGVLAKPGDSALSDTTVDNTISPSNKNGNWQSRVESGGDKTTQIEAPGVVLPVELVAFSATVDAGEALLSWETASETNHAGFAIEHAANGEPFSEIGFVEGHGTTDKPRTYSFRTAKLAAGTHLFRLKQIDFDGGFEYSPIVEVATEIPGTHVLSHAYPNPFNPSTSFSLGVSNTQHVDVELYDALGRRVHSVFSGVIEANVTRVLSIRASDLPSGSYVVVARGSNFRDSRNVVLLK